ncbi:MAG: hypothetical protein OXU79_17430 [Gemmatimonadota bacterium]|nr:hypothetical protein [Gemmatimonadota bacterium]
MDVRQAAGTARAFIADLFEGEEIAHVGLEEVDFDEASNEWKITIGFSRPWDRKSVTPAMGEVRLTRSYKVVRINDESGNVISVKHRFFEASEWAEGGFRI